MKFYFIAVLLLVSGSAMAQGVRFPSPVNVVDTGGSPTINFYTANNVLRATVSSGATAAFGLKGSSGTRVMTVFQTGNTLLGSGSSDPGTRLKVEGDTISQGYIFFYTAAGTNTWSIGTNTLNVLDWRNSSNLARMTLYDNGAPPIGGTGANLVTPSILAITTANGSPTMVAEAKSGQTADILTAIDSTYTVKYFNVNASGSVSASSLAGSGTRCVQVNNSGVFAVASGACSGSAGSDTNVIYNDGGSLAGSSAFTWNKTTNTLSLGLGTGGANLVIDRNASNTVAQILFEVGGSSGVAGVWKVGPLLGAFEIIEGVSGNDFYRVDQTGLTRITGTSSGSVYPLDVRDTGGSPGICFHRSTSTLAGCISSGSTAALSVQDSGGTHRLTIFQGGDVQVGSITDQGYKFYSNGSTGLNGLVDINGVTTVAINSAGSTAVLATNSASTGFGFVGSGGSAGGQFTNSNAGTKVLVLTSSAISEAPTIQIGHGSPEGVVTADIGSIFMRTNGGASTVLYIKESNSGGNTGWIAK